MARCKQAALAKEFVIISGLSYTSIPIVPDVSYAWVSVSFTCTERASAGRFTVPVEVLSLLPPTPSAFRGFGPEQGWLYVGSAPLFDPAKIENVRGLDAAHFYYSVTNAKAVTFLP